LEGLFALRHPSFNVLFFFSKPPINVLFEEGMCIAISTDDPLQFIDRSVDPLLDELWMCRADYLFSTVR
jgi:hypothetical protein